MNFSIKENKIQEIKNDFYSNLQKSPFCKILLKEFLNKDLPQAEEKKEKE